jgi:hypothetical protein
VSDADDIDSSDLVSVMLGFTDVRTAFVNVSRGHGYLRKKDLFDARIPMFRCEPLVAKIRNGKWGLFRYDRPIRLDKAIAVCKTKREAEALAKKLQAQGMGLTVPVLKAIESDPAYRF